MALRFALVAVVALTSALTTSCSTAHVPSPSGGAPRLADVELIDRTNGQTLPVYWHRGDRWVAGAPGHRYAIVVRNRSGGRVLAVIAVDGVNAVSGETAAWEQTGYVLDPGRTFDIRGWRKSASRVAAFEFTSLGDSYAARTGRPENIGVIGVALFREAPRPESVPLASSAREKSTADAAGASSGTAQTAPSVRNEMRLGTGHGRNEASRVTYTDFQRARPAPDEVITIRYDSRENLIAMGILPGVVPSLPPGPRPFPGSESGFVPDPPQ